jgi:raffinose synthase
MNNASGDAYVQTCQSLEAVFVNSGDNPFELIRDSIKYVFSFLF